MDWKHCEPIVSMILNIMKRRGRLFVPWWTRWSRSGSCFQRPAWLWARCWAASPGRRCAPCGLTSDSRPRETEGTRLEKGKKVGGRYKKKAGCWRFTRVCSSSRLQQQERDFTSPSNNPAALLMFWPRPEQSESANTLKPPVINLAGFCFQLLLLSFSCSNALITGLPTWGVLGVGVGGFICLRGRSWSPNYQLLSCSTQHFKMHFLHEEMFSNIN